MGGLVNSFKTDKAATGTLTSPAFPINSNYINLMVGGMKNPEATAVRLLVDNNAVRTASGNNSESLEWVSWDVRELKGKNARIEIVDNATDARGHILVDHIVLSDKPVDKQKVDGIFIDYGTDNYAGVTWSGVPAEDGRRIFMGWMSNWLYGQVVPTENWRSAMTIARTLTLEKTTDGLRLASLPVEELKNLYRASYEIEEQTVTDVLQISEKLPFNTATFELKLDLAAESAANADFAIEISNSKNQKVVVGYDPARKQYYFDRTKAGGNNFFPEFAGVYYAPRLAEDATFPLTILVDVSSLELFADGGKTVMTEIFFPDEPFTKISLRSGKKGIKVRSGKVTNLKSIWEVAN